MTTRIETGGPSTGVEATVIAPRTTPPPAQPFRQVFAAGAQAVVSGAEAAVRRLPGGPILAAAMRPGGSYTPGAPLAPGASAEGPTGTVPPAGAPGMPGGGSVEDALAHSAEMNLYYLQLQEQVAAENRSYTTISNVLKAQHDTVKNAISNLR